MTLTAPASTAAPTVPAVPPVPTVPTATPRGMLVPFELLFYGAVVGTTVLTLAWEQGTSATWRAAVVAVAAALAGWYAIVGHPVAAQERSARRHYLAATGLLVGFAAALALTGFAANLLIGLPALMYLILASRPASVYVVLLCAAPTAVNLAKTRDLNQTLHSTVPIGIASILFAFVLAYVISDVSRRSHERARLIEELESTRAELARVSREAGVAEERQRLAGEIHDTVAQGLSSVVMLIQAAEASMAIDQCAARQHLGLAARTARENLAETRAIVAALTPAPLADASLPQALRRLAHGAPASRAQVHVDVAGQPRRAPTAVEVVLLRAAQEGLANALRHANARRVDLCLSYAAATVVLEVRDDGCGFAPSGDLPGYGLPAMQARTVQVGGEWSIHSGPQEGTLLRIEVPA